MRASTIKQENHAVLLNLFKSNHNAITRTFLKYYTAKNKQIAIIVVGRFSCDINLLENSLLSTYQWA